MVEGSFPTSAFAYNGVMSTFVNTGLARAYEFACHSAACAPPSAGGTGGSNSGGSRGGGAAGAGGGSADGAVDKQARRMKPGTRRTIKDEAGTVIGMVKRDSKGIHHYESAHGSVMGGSKNVADAITRLKQAVNHDLHHNASWTRPADRTPEQKALLKGYRDKNNADQMSSRAAGASGQALKAYGAVKATQVSVSKDGTVKVKGQATKEKIVKRHDGYDVPGTFNKDGRMKRYRTQAAAKSAVARYITAIANT